jgi:hypothetical protein
VKRAAGSHAGTPCLGRHFGYMGKNRSQAARLFLTVGICVVAVLGPASANPIAGGGTAFLKTGQFGSGIILVRGRHGGHRGGHIRGHAHGRHIGHRHARQSWHSRQFGRLREPIFGSGQAYIRSETASENRASVSQPRAAEEPVALAQQSMAVGCDAAAEIVGGYAFSRVTPVSCSGTAYQFQATRQDRSYSVTLNPADGDLISVHKLSRTVLR